eukprot:jgi/Bigna1/126617/aug1.3_g1325
MGGENAEQKNNQSAPAIKEAEHSSEYWKHRYRPCVARDLGHSCRECKKPFKKIGELIAIRRGGRIEMRYHKACFSGNSDPRSQSKGTHLHGKWADKVSKKAPKGRYQKMRTTAHCFPIRIVQARV